MAPVNFLSGLGESWADCEVKYTVFFSGLQRKSFTRSCGQDAVLILLLCSQHFCGAGSSYRPCGRFGWRPGLDLAQLWPL